HRTARAVQAAVDRQRHPDDRAAGDALLDLAVLQGRRLAGLLLREPRDAVRADRGGRAHPGPGAGPGGAAARRLALQGRGRARGCRAHRLLLPRGDRADPGGGSAGGGAHRRLAVPVLRRLRVLLPGSVLAAAAAARALHLGSGPHATVSGCGHPSAVTSRKEPSVTEYTKPRTRSVSSSSVAAPIRRSDWRTSAAGSAKASAAQAGRIPVSSSICALKSSSVKVSMPQSV